MCRCLGTGRIVYGSDTETVRQETICPCAYRGRSVDRPDSGLVGNPAVRLSRSAEKFWQDVSEICDREDGIDASHASTDKGEASTTASAPREAALMTDTAGIGRIRGNTGASGLPGRNHEQSSLLAVSPLQICFGERE